MADRDTLEPVSACPMIDLHSAFFIIGAEKIEDFFLAHFFWFHEKLRNCR